MADCVYSAKDRNGTVRLFYSPPDFIELTGVWCAFIPEGEEGAVEKERARIFAAMAPAGQGNETCMPCEIPQLKPMKGV